MSRNALNQANQWAAQRKQALDKSKQLRDQRKYNLAFVGEMSVASDTATTTRRRIPSLDAKYKTAISEQNQKKPSTAKYGLSLMNHVPSEEEMSIARDSLMLLKSKMKNPGEYSSGYYESRQKSRGYIDEETHEYLQYAPGNRELEQDQNFNDVYHTGNPNYRKVFKPVIIDRNYVNNQFNRQREIDHLNQVGSKKAQILMHANKYGPPRPGYQPPPQQMYEDHPQEQQGNNRKRPPIRPNRNQPKPVDREPTDFLTDEEFAVVPSKTIPTRRPLKTISSSQEKRNYDINASLDAPKSQFSKPSYQGNKIQNKEDMGMGMSGYEDQSIPETKMGQNQKGNRGGIRSNIPQTQANRGFSSYNGQDDNEEPEDSQAAFSKPNLKKKPAPTKTKSPPRISNDGNFNGFGGTVPEGANEDQGPVEECPNGCGRSFNPAALEKHAKVCQKVFLSKRKKFDSAQQRNEAQEEMESNYGPPRKGPSKPMRNNKAGGNKSSKWKAQSEALRAGMRAARGEKISQEEEAALSKANEEHLVPCPHCGRKFNEQAATRHISFCETKSKLGGRKR